MTLRTETYWCYNGTNVTSASPSTTHQDPWNYSWDGLIVNSYGYVNTPNWDMVRVGRWRWIFDYNVKFCIRNEMHLNGNGTYSTNPAEYIC